MTDKATETARAVTTSDSEKVVLLPTQNEKDELSCPLCASNELQVVEVVERVITYPVTKAGDPDVYDAPYFMVVGADYDNYYDCYESDVVLKRTVECMEHKCSYVLEVNKFIMVTDDV